MKFISITKSINIRPDWATIGAKLKAGTPLDITGAVANSSAAVGILADDAEKSSAEVAVVTEGSIDLAEVTASYGELEDDCIAAIKGIAFIGSDGDPIVPSGGGGGDNRFIVTCTPTSENLSGVMDKTIGEINEAWTQGKEIWFSVTVGEWTSCVPGQELNYRNGRTYPSFNAHEVTDRMTGMPGMLWMCTCTSNYPDDAGYDVYFFPFTTSGSGDSVPGGDSPD